MRELIGMVWAALGQRPGTGPRSRSDPEVACLRRIATDCGDSFWSARLEESERLFIEYVSPSWESIHGYSREKFIERPEFLSEIMLAEDRPRWRETLRRLRESGQSQSIEYRTKTGDGSIVWVKTTLQPVRDARGRVYAVDAITRDVTERINSEQTIRESEARFRTIAEQSLVGVYLIKNGRLLYVNDACAGMLGCRRDELIGRTLDEWSRHVHDEDRDFVRGQVDKKQAGAESAVSEYETRIQRKDGVFRWFSVYSKTMKPQSSKPGDYTIHGMMVDVTSRKEAEDALRRSEERYRLLADHSHDVIWTLDTEGKFTYVSPSVRNVLGYEEGELLGKHFEVVLDPEMKTHPFGLFQEGMDGIRNEARFESRILTKSGERQWCEITAVFLRDDGSPVGVQGSTRDISLRKRWELSLKENEYLLAKSQQIAHIGSWSIRLHGDESEFVGSDELFRILGVSREEFDTGYPDLARRLIHQDDLERVRGHFRAVLEARTFEPFECRIVRPDGEERVLMLQGTLVEDSDDAPAHLIGTAQDETERRRIERERRDLEAQMRHAQKMESLGVLAGGIAHDFNNLLVGILGNAELALHKLEPNAPLTEYLRAIEESAQRAAELTNQMLAYSGKGKFVVESFGLGELVKEMADLLKMAISKKAALSYNFASGLPFVEGDPTQLRQVVMNLITNASESIGDEMGSISIGTGALRADNRYLEQCYLGEDLEPGEYVYLEVTDTGCGMDEETRSKMFDPFFTTKFSGRGLGLAAVLGIVRSHRGALDVSSRAGEGTSVRLILPRSARMDAVPSTKGGHSVSVEHRWRGTGTILVVDDEAPVRDYCARILQHFGYNVITAEDGEEGVNVFRERRRHIDAVLMDLTMPVMNGDEAFNEMRKIDPGVKVIISSGFSEEDAADRFANNNVAGFIHKPYRAEDLMRLLNDIVPAQETRGA